MLSVTTYPQDYVDARREAVRAQLAAYADLVKRAPTGAADAFEPGFGEAMVLALDASFCHRSRTLELKDGNPLNEVRVLCGSILENGGVLLKDRQIRLNPETSVLGYAPGDEIRLGPEDVARLAEAFLNEIEVKFAG